MVVGLCLINSPAALADCPSADLTSDCFVNFEDFALMAKQWLTGDTNIPDDMAYIPGGGFGMGDHFDPEGGSDELPVHAVLLDSFFMSKFEITNSQYCDYLNDANSLGLIEVRSGVVYASPAGTDPYCDTHSYDTDSQIDYNDVSGTFSVREKGGRDMSDDPMVEVSWYGAAAYCNWRSGEEGYESCYNLSTWDCNFAKQGYRLATEAEWEYAARGGLSGKRFPWADPNISHSRANYYANPGSYPYDENPTSGYHPDYNDVFPYTAPVGSFSANGYGLYDITDNVWEWCNDWYDSNYYGTSPYDNPEGPASGFYRVLRSGSWNYVARDCRVAYRYDCPPDGRDNDFGFRIVLDF